MDTPLVFSDSTDRFMRSLLCSFFLALSVIVTGVLISHAGWKNRYGQTIREEIEAGKCGTQTIITGPQSFPFDGGDRTIAMSELRDALRSKDTA